MLQGLSMGLGQKPISQGEMSCDERENSRYTETPVKQVREALESECFCPNCFTDTTWVRDELPTRALPEFLTTKIRGKIIFSASRFSVVCNAEINT